MVVFLLILHITVTILLVISVLLQESKGGGLSGVFGGGGQSVFGGQGANEFMTKVTSVLAILFMLTSLLLAMNSLRGGGVGSGVSEDIKKLQQEAQKEAASQLPQGGIPQSSLPLDNNTENSNTPNTLPQELPLDNQTNTNSSGQ